MIRAVALILLLAGCGREASAPPEAPTNATAPRRPGPPVTGRIAYVYDRDDGRSMCVGPPAEVPGTCLDGGWFPGPPDPAGARLLLVRDDALAIWDAGEVRAIVDGLSGIRDPTWAGDAVIARATVGDVAGIWRFAPDTDPTLLTTSALGDHEPHASPTGRVAFTSSRTGHADLYLLEAGAPRAVTDDPADDLRPRWSPDGTILAFLRNDGGRGRVWLWRDGAKRPLADLPGDVHDLDLAWSPDGSRLAIPRMQEGGGAWLSVVGLDGAELAHIDAAGQHPAWSPDGRWLAYDVRHGDRVVIEIVHRSGADRRTAVAPADGDAWLPRWLNR